MEIEKYSPKWLLKKINASKTDAHKLMHIIEYRKELVESTEKQYAINGVSQQRELLLDFLSKVNGNLIVHPHLQMNSDFVDDYLKSNNCG